MSSQMTNIQRDIELSSIYEISKILCSSLDLQKTIRQILNILSSHLQLQRTMVSLVQHDNEVHVIGAVGLSQEEIDRGRFQAGEGVIGKIVKMGVPIVVPDIANEPLFLNKTRARDLSDDKPIAFIGVPIKAAGKVLGVLSADRETRSRPGRIQHDMRFLKMVADLIGQTMHLHELVAAERKQLLNETYQLQKEVRAKPFASDVIGQSPCMQDIFGEVRRSASVSSTVLLRGESGTGKEMIAQSIHDLSPRKKAPFIRVNCAALTESLLESELFGHEKGAFTGAQHERKGRFELANGGTLFLDEIGEISPAFQSKLLRVLQEREFERVGGTKSIRVDVRLIAATNRNLEEAVSSGEFRADLYFRLNVVTIVLPPLRDRREDIPVLAIHFLDKFNRVNNRHLDISTDAMKILTDCYWPGNVRELENCVERTATMANGTAINALDLPCQHDKCFSLALGHVWRASGPVPDIRVVGVPNNHPSATPDVTHVESQDGKMPEFKSGRERFIWAMEQSGWVQAKAARLLNVTPRQMGYALQKYDIKVKKF
ncbi:Nif-specific regulatory protein NifA [Methyloglobulus morosus KoM1]|uniref:Nif-specific regulatory protein n=1 Tax=Methyloglobulus morosus KoM1 TaxID=1116472 RepID=V5C5J1_9GAMM|nr:nif-specific transcriptional activator NifA [Methyloglobulus morosus]ESS73727.1 Nif-specific regulatory protein NifA [Methyloglobulus morosus KoM1]